MTIAIIFASLMVLFAVALSFAIDLERTRAELLRLALQFIAEAESMTDFTGEQKMQAVVCRMAVAVPSALTGIITHEKLQEIAQAAYNRMADFARQRQRHG